MSGEDVYDVAVPLWCDICQADHRSCEDDDDLDLRTEGGVPAAAACRDVDGDNPNPDREQR